MTNLFGGMHPKCALGMIFILLTSSACQPTQQSPSSSTPLSTLPSVKLTATDMISSSWPMPIASPASTATSQPTATEIPRTLSRSGPWLVYKIPYPIEHTAYSEYKYFVVNQDGTGRESLGDASGSGEIQASSFNHLVFFPGAIYLFESTQLDWTLVHDDQRQCWLGASCDVDGLGSSDYTGSNEDGLLARVTGDIEEKTAELLIYELPDGKIRDQFPVLFQCPEDDESCDTSNIEWWNFETEWSPDGRYLAFAAALENQENQSSDLYLYDAQTRNTLRLTSGPDSVSLISWSPDSEWIIMGELHESPYPYTTSLWAVSPANGEIRKLYSLAALYPRFVSSEAGYPQAILGWLDDRRFIVYGGTTLVNAFDLPVYGLQLVDLDARKATRLVDDVVVAAELDTDHATVAVSVYDPEKSDAYEGSGIYLVSTSNPKLRYMGSGELYPIWHAELGLFVTEESCENDPQGKRAFDYRGEWQCIHLSWPDSFPSPDGQWHISIQDGTWLKTNGNQPIQIIPGNATQAIWRPDSQGFFFVADQILYYVSLPQATLTVIDQNVKDWFDYQWVGGD